MSLQEYRGRLIVLRPTASAQEAAIAMADNHVGSVIVADRDGIVGIVTDRDLCLKVVGNGLNSRLVALHEVMTTDVHTIDVSASIQDAITMMRKYGCRRLPLMYGFTPIGMVTLDDLLGEQEINCASAAAVLCAQLQQGAKNKRPGTIRPRLRGIPRGPSSRANRALDRLLVRIEESTGLTDSAESLIAFTIVLSAVVERLEDSRAERLLSLLPIPVQQEILSRVTQKAPQSRAIVIDDIELTLGVSFDTATRILGGIVEVLDTSVLAEEFGGDAASMFPQMGELIWAEESLSTELPA